MQKVFETKGKPSLLEFKVVPKTFLSCSFDIVVFDKQRQQSYYSRQNYVVNQPQTITINLPVTPNKIGVDVEPINVNAEFFEITCTLKPLPTLRSGLNKEIFDFMKWANWFNINASILPDKIYYQQPKGKYYINYMPIIIDEEYGELITPARIHDTTNEVQIAADYYIPLSVPARDVVLAHEISHNVFSSNEEFIPDEKACEICKLWGYTREQIYSGFDEFLIDTPLNEARRQRIYNILFVNGNM